MGTRGTYGFYKGGVDKLTYNHYDSYPEGLGKDIVEFIRATSIQELNEIFSRIALVDEDSRPTITQQEECIRYYDKTVGEQTPTKWYGLLRKAQGDLSIYKGENPLKYMIDYGTYIRYGSDCEYGYVINLDTNKLEVYECHGNILTYDNIQYKGKYNRYYTSDEPDEYGWVFASILKAEFPLDNIPQNWIEIAFPENKDEDEE